MLADAGPELIDGLASRELICLDDLDAVAGNSAWESALFDLCNQILDADRLPDCFGRYVGARMSGCELPDLAKPPGALAGFSGSLARR